MGIIINCIIENFNNESFSSWDIHKITKINQKVIKMNLKRMHNKNILHYNPTRDIFTLIIK